MKIVRYATFFIMIFLAIGGYAFFLEHEKVVEAEPPLMKNLTPKRVVSMHPGITQLLLELQLENTVVATVRPYQKIAGELGTRYEKLPLLQEVYTPSRETVMELQPDLIIGWEHQFSEMEIGPETFWNKRGIRTYIVPTTLQNAHPSVRGEFFALLDDIGQMFGCQEKTDVYKAQIDHRINALPTVKERKKIIILQAYGDGKYTLYGNSYLIDDIVRLAGGDNLVEKTISFVSAEQVLAYDPDFILFVSYPGADGGPMKDEQAKEKLQQDKEIKSLPALKAGNIINVPFAQVNGADLSSMDLMEKIGEKLNN
jgi:iron complex transport system substrate-binding protein